MKQHTKRVGDKVGFWRKVTKGDGYQTKPAVGRIVGVDIEGAVIIRRGKKIYNRPASELRHITGKNRA